MSGKQQDGIVLQSGCWYRHLGTSLLHMQEQGVMCDLDLVPTNGPAIRVHRCVLSACSPSLCSMVTAGGAQLHVNAAHHVLTYIVTFCYTGKVSVRESEIAGVSRAAKEYGIKELHGVCVTKLAGNKGKKKPAMTQGTPTQNQNIEPAKPTSKVPPPMSSAVNQAALRFEPMITAPSSTSMLPILSKIKGLDAFESSQELTFDVHFLGEPTSSLPEAPPTPPPQKTSNQEEMPLVPGKTDLPPPPLPAAPPAAPAPAAPAAPPAPPPPLLPDSFLCVECGKVFDKLASLQMHEKRHKAAAKKATSGEGGGTVTFTCKTCEKVFKSKQNLRTHAKTHVADKAYRCAFCPKAFVRRTELTMHERTHTGEKPYRCRHADCGRAFAQHTNLLDHERTHTGARPYACDRCGAAFSNSSNLRRHKKFHDRRVALGLPQALRQRSEAVTVLPSGEKVYPCKVCDKQFKRLRNLEDHTRTHTGERPFKCIVCQRGFARQPNLLRHMKFHKKKQLLQPDEEAEQQQQQQQQQSVSDNTSRKDNNSSAEAASRGDDVTDVTNSFDNFSLVNAAVPGYQQFLSQGKDHPVFLATDTATVTTDTEPMAVDTVTIATGQQLSSVPVVMSVDADATKVASHPGKMVTWVNASVPSGDVLTLSAVPASSTATSLGYQPTAEGNQFQYLISAVPSQSDFAGSASVQQPVSLVPFQNSSVSSSAVLSLPTLPHSISSVPHSAATVPNFTPALSQALPMLSTSSLSHSTPSAPFDSSTLPLSTPPTVSHPPPPQIPQTISSLAPHLLPNPHSSSPLSSVTPADPTSYPMAPNEGSFADSFNNYFGPGSFMAQLDSIPYTQTLNTSALYLPAAAGAQVDDDDDDQNQHLG